MIGEQLVGSEDGLRRVAGPVPPDEEEIVERVVPVIISLHMNGAGPVMGVEGTVASTSDAYLSRDWKVGPVDINRQSWMCVIE